MENGEKFEECAFLNDLIVSLNFQLNKRNLIVFPTCLFFSFLYLTFSKFSRNRHIPREGKNIYIKNYDMKKR